ncbi:MAG: HNH endonuclease [Lachnospiraceae bacterium]|nr:HNH endonuclease [Lachnospiraceae bacterium]
MDYIRKRRWVRYNHMKCKMYLRNDFNFECAYCRLREKDTGVVQEDNFQKDHFVAISSGEDIDLDAYDNMIYACEKCNSTKSNMNTEMLLNPCKDDIYSGVNPHVIRLGESEDYQLAEQTPEGKQFIDSLKLNSKYYREMRKAQEQSDKNDEELKKLLNLISDCSDIPGELLHKLNTLVSNNFLVQADSYQTPSFKCGRSKAGQAFQEVLAILDELEISYELLFAEDDLDIKIQYNDKEYLCEIVLNDTAEKTVRNMRLKKEQIEKWETMIGNFGFLYYYIKTGKLDLYIIGEEDVDPVCLEEGCVKY